MTEQTDIVAELRTASCSPTASPSIHPRAADEIERLRPQVGRAKRMAAARGKWKKRAEELETERDALRQQVAELEGRLQAEQLVTDAMVIDARKRAVRLADALRECKPYLPIKLQDFADKALAQESGE